MRERNKLSLSRPNFLKRDRFPRTVVKVGLQHLGAYERFEDHMYSVARGTSQSLKVGSCLANSMTMGS